MENCFGNVKCADKNRSLVKKTNVLTMNLVERILINNILTSFFLKMSSLQGSLPFCLHKAAFFFNKTLWKFSLLRSLYFLLHVQ